MLIPIAKLLAVGLLWHRRRRHTRQQNEEKPRTDGHESKKRNETKHTAATVTNDSSIRRNGRCQRRKKRKKIILYIKVYPRRWHSACFPFCVSHFLASRHFFFFFSSVENEIFAFVLVGWVGAAQIYLHIYLFSWAARVCARTETKKELTMIEHAKNKYVDCLAVGATPSEISLVQISQRNVGTSISLEC